VRAKAGNTAQVEDQARQWRYSDEWARGRRIVVAVVVAFIVLFGGVAALLVKQQVELGPTLSRANEEARAARSALDAAQVARDGAQEAWTAAEKAFNEATRGTDGAPGVDSVVQRRRDQADLAGSEYQMTDYVLRQERASATLANAKAQDAQRSASTLSGYWVLFGLTAFVVALLLTVIIGYTRSERRRRWENREVLREAEQTAADSDLEVDFASLWRRNQHRLQEYHRIVLNHAESSRDLTTGVLLAGFAIVAVLGILASRAGDVTSAVATSVAATAGATVTAFIARNVLRNTETSTSEVNQFFRNPMEMERTLAAERLIEMMSEKERDAARLLVIRGLSERALPLTDMPARADEVESQP
jgi:hypothetical protein